MPSSATAAGANRAAVSSAADVWLANKRIFTENSSFRMEFEAPVNQLVGKPSSVYTNRSRGTAAQFAGVSLRTGTCLQGQEIPGWAGESHPTRSSCTILHKSDGENSLVSGETGRGP